ncbi:hypothetical protein [Mesorhizobium sp. Pch-S]|uniref:hypothetical protein n=1 Tax=Mesorhizobium sp. Pch-S TaxID=2082387 RepID=UPI0010139E05|nr:hypothetical protein [Mesorhizobium sp. Pch-S]
MSSAGVAEKWRLIGTSLCTSLLLAWFDGDVRAESQAPDFFPEKITCPTSERAVFELISKNALGARERLKVVYNETRPQTVFLGAAEADGAFQDFYEAPVGSSDPDKADVAKNVLNLIQEPHMKFCLEPNEDKREHFWNVYKTKGH